MLLTPGSRLGPYEILDAIGSGGMGEVYRARDTRLDRLVALKVLPRDVERNPERRERFEREAKVVAALNHPNIVTIHSVERVDDVSFLTMELVEGRPLANLIPSGGLPLGRLLGIAIPLVDAIAAAHQKGITHRDLKPANVMLGSGELEGRVKVLDFGLAKLSGGAIAGDGSTALATALATGEGRILGTVAYMSPEQAEGKPIDGRSDLFSLGVMLYEMATGQRPFTGETSISIISAIVKDTPKSVTDLNPALPRDLARIVRRALAKDPERRYQTAKDLRNDLEELKASLDSGELADTRPAAAGIHDRRSRVWPWVAGAAAVAATAAIVLALTSGNRQGAAPPPARAVQLSALTSTGNADAAAISPDGKYVAFVQQDASGESVWVHQIASRSTVQIVPPAPGVTVPALTVTPDGSFVDFIRLTEGRWELWRVPFLGGSARRLVERAQSAPGWSPNGKKMAFLVNVPPVSAERQLIVADSDGSNPQVVATRKLPKRYLTLTLTYRPEVRPVWLPDGQSIVVQASDEVNAPGVVQVVRVDVASGAESTLHEFRNGVAGGFRMGLALSPDGRAIIATIAEEAGAPAQVVRIDLVSQSTARMTNDLAHYGGIAVAGDIVVTTRRESRSTLWVADVMGRGERQIGRELPSPVRGLVWAGPSRFLYCASLAGGFGLWSTDVASAASQLMLPGATGPSLSADGKILVFEKGTREIWRSDPDGGRAVRLKDVAGSMVVVTADGSRVLYTSSQSGVQTAWAADLAGGAPRQFSSLLTNGLAVSRDGRQIMLRSNALEQAGLYVFRPDGGEAMRRLPLVRSRGDFEWNPDGTGLTYLDPTGSSLWLLPVDGGAPRQLMSFTPGDVSEFAWSPDGKQIALVRQIVTSNIVLLKGGD
jgi:Tol biopolymer transport system component